MDRPSNHRSRTDLQVHSVEHFNDLLTRGHSQFRIDDRGSEYWIQAHKPTKRYDKVGSHTITNAHAYDIIIRVLEAKGSAIVYCPAEWTAHEVAQEIVRWEPKEK